MLKILLVDDKPENLLALEEVLRAPDRELHRAGSGNDALRLVLKHDFAVVLLDVEMPGMDGYETAQLMRSAERSKLVPIIFVTAGDRSEERVFRGYETGAVDFLYKPLNIHTLKCKVDVFVELYRKTRELEHTNVSLEQTTAELRDKIVDLEHVHRTLSHDLRGPLRSVVRFTGSLLDDHPELGDDLGRVLRAGKRMESMLDDLYRLLQVSSGAAQRTEVDATAVLAEVTDALRSDLEQAQVSLIGERLPTLHANRALLAQVLQNLIANAIKFRGVEAPEIHVSAVATDGGWRFMVRDNGAGIPPEDHQRIFELFERRDATAPGTGVGLTLCRRAVEKLGGKIWVESRAGEGATFHFTIPRVARSVDVDA
jgi:two-component system, sensor histidine kinase and response regulator